MKCEAREVRIHESAHAVIARKLGVRVIAVTARAHEKFRGMTFTDRRGLERNVIFHENEIKIYLAGHLAQMKKWPESDWEKVQSSCLIDWFSAYGHAHEVALARGLRQPKRMNIAYQYPATTKIVRDQIDQTKILIDANWDAIERVAKALHFNPRLEQGAIDALIAGERRRIWKKLAILNHP